MKGLNYTAVILCLLSFCIGCRKMSYADNGRTDTPYRTFSVTPVFEWNGWGGDRDKMMLSIFAGYMKDGDRIVTADNMELRYSDNAWKPVGELLLASDAVAQDILLVYPALEAGDICMDAIGYAAGDGMFMAGKVRYDGVGEDTDFQINVEHLSGRVEFCVRLGDEYGEDAVISRMTVLGWKNGFLDLWKMSLQPLDAAANEVMEVPLVYNAEKGTFEGGCSVIPQKFLAGKINVTISENGLEHEIGPADLQYWISVGKGKITRLEFTAGTNNLKLGDVSVSDWIPGDTGNGGVFLN